MSIRTLNLCVVEKGKARLDWTVTAAAIARQVQLWRGRVAGQYISGEFLNCVCLHCSGALASFPRSSLVQTSIVVLLVLHSKVLRGFSSCLLKQVCRSGILRVICIQEARLTPNLSFRRMKLSALVLNRCVLVAESLYLELLST